MSLVTVNTDGVVLNTYILPNSVCASEKNMVCFLIPDAVDGEPEK